MYCRAHGPADGGVHIYTFDKKKKKKKSFFTVPLLYFPNIFFPVMRRALKPLWEVQGGWKSVAQSFSPRGRHQRYHRW